LLKFEKNLSRATARKADAVRRCTWKARDKAHLLDSTERSVLHHKDQLQPLEKALNKTKKALRESA